jgi:hypothetical protein
MLCVSSFRYLLGGRLQESMRRPIGDSVRLVNMESVDGLYKVWESLAF